jgi:hypothetical protein
MLSQWNCCLSLLAATCVNKTPCVQRNGMQVGLRSPKVGTTSKHGDSPPSQLQAPGYSNLNANFHAGVKTSEPSPRRRLITPHIKCINLCIRTYMHKLNRVGLHNHKITVNEIRKMREFSSAVLDELHLEKE